MSAWPTDDLTNDNLDQTTDDPSLARAELNALLLKVQAILAGAGTAADEVLKLDGNANAGLTVGTAQRTLAKTADYTVVVADLGRTILVDATSGDVTISLPAAGTAGNGFPVTIKKIDSSVNTVTVDGNGVETIDGATTVVLKDRYQGVSIVCDATDWSVIGVAGFRGALVYLDAAQSIPNTTTTKLNFDQESYDTDSIHDNVTNNTRLTVPPGVTRIKLSAQVRWTFNATGVRQFDINGSVGLEAGHISSYIPTASGGTTVHNSVSPVINVVAGDYFELALYQNSGGALNAEGYSSGNACWFAMEIIK